MVVSLNKGTPIKTQKYYDCYRVGAVPKVEGLAVPSASRGLGFRVSGLGLRV